MNIKIVFLATFVWISLRASTQDSCPVLTGQELVVEDNAEQVVIPDNTPSVLRDEPIDATFAMRFFAADICHQAQQLVQRNAPVNDYFSIEYRAVGLAYMVQKELEKNGGNPQELAEIRQRMLAIGLWLQGQRAINFRY